MSDAEELARLRGVRTVLYRHLKNVEGELNDIILNFDINHEETLIQLSAIKLRFTNKNDKVKELNRFFHI